ncbi:ABC transporter ATP-binding protein [Mycobacterium sp. 141]|uniref:ABC transporter ATP-binding protein n=1 Tax=Mycobacterium sp. 141 TaxID=1120797 RepID=UPI0003705D01|nr:ABC transporter ATP-binding protein [Mycobacterium sp. 141]
MQSVLELAEVDIAAGDTPLCRGVDLSIGSGETHVLFGPNGSGKSSLLAGIMGLPQYRVSSGTIRLFGEHIETLGVDERARRGVGMAFQRPPALQGVSLRDLATSLNAVPELVHQAELLDLGALIDRDINAGFSGGEIKRWEILKLCLQRPALCLFDEPESGVDLQHIAAVGAAINRLLCDDSDDGADGHRSALIITHTGFILDHLRADVGHLMVNGRLVYSGDPYELFHHIKNQGYTAPDLMEGLTA